MTSALGAGGLSVSQVAGFILLGDGWTLTKNKTDIAAHADELETAIFKRCESMLRKAEQQARLIESHALNVKVSLKLAAALKQLDEKPEPKQQDEPDEPSEDEDEGTDEQETESKESEPQSGEPTERESKAPKKVGQLAVDWKWFCSRTIGEVDITGGMVWLNNENRWLTSLRVPFTSDGSSVGSGICQRPSTRVTLSHATTTLRRTPS